MRRTDMALSKAEREELRIADRLGEMMATEGWKIYAGLVDHHLRDMQSQAVEVMHSLDDALARNAQKGAVKAFLLCKGLPASIIASASDIRSRKGNESEE